MSACTNGTCVNDEPSWLTNSVAEALDSVCASLLTAVRPLSFARLATLMTCRSAPTWHTSDANESTR